MKKDVLITVTTYPLPSESYDELVCTAGIDENNEWIRIYPIPLSMLIESRFRKYDVISIGLNERSPSKDFRPNTFSPKIKNFSDMKIKRHIGTEKKWQKRKEYCLSKTYSSMEKLIDDAYNENSYRSLAVFKPSEIVSFKIEEDDRDWKPKWKAKMNQPCLFTDDDKKTFIKKVPYKFIYKFKDADGKVRRMMVKDWEIGQLYWNCLKSTEGDEDAALEKVYQKYGVWMVERDLYFFLGTTLQWHRRGAKNPFLIVGLFYPPKTRQDSLFA